jgi:hypothetical protein
MNTYRRQKIGIPGNKPRPLPLVGFRLTDDPLSSLGAGTFHEFDLSLESNFTPLRRALLCGDDPSDT